MNLQSHKIPKHILSAISEETVLGIPAISLWEIAMLVRKRRIILPGSVLEWTKIALSMPKIKILPLTPEIAALSETLPMHGDPADRLIGATAIIHGCCLATIDVPLSKLLGLQIISAS
ncbi:MAG: hypothetical protein Ta2F_17720 [Termitinemataceae bacterium]|nr:MAG: hypothetical protein Ta2F_17720 [Termitinemataceae bacterium]